MSETITNTQEGTLLNWTKQVGDPVKAGDVIAEIEADKATIEIESSASGVLLQTLVDVGQPLQPGMPLAVIGAAGEQPASAPAKQPVPQPAPINEEAGEVLPKEVKVQASGGNGGQPVGVRPPAAPVADMAVGEIKASPLARKIAFEKGIDLRQVKGTGPSGRITKTDIENFQPGQAAPAVRPGSAPASAPAPAPAPAPSRPMPTQAVSTGPGISEEPLSRMRQRIGARMTESKQTVPHFYVTVDVDMAVGMALRKQINENLPDEQKISVNDLVVKATALALRQFPNLNSHFSGDKIVHHEHVNIGIAVALEGGGLLNVVAKDADVTSISRMAQRNKEMIAAARAGKVRGEDMEGSTFTISNLGPYDVDQFVAIIVPPEAGIIAVGSAKDVPVVINGEIKIGTRMKCTLSADHRVTDGAEGAAFMQAFKKLLESPMRLLV